MKKIFLHIILISSLLSVEINGNGTTVANFLEIDIGSAATAMGGAYVSIANDVSSAYWNPAGLSFVNKKQAYFMYQPWILDTDSFCNVCMYYRFSYINLQNLTQDVIITHQLLMIKRCHSKVLINCCWLPHNQKIRLLDSNVQRKVHFLFSGMPNVEGVRGTEVFLSMFKT